MFLDSPYTDEEEAKSICFGLKILHASSNSKVPNILLSILAAKKNELKQVKTFHKKRETGIESIRRFKLIIFCIKSFLEILKFKSH